MAQAMQMGTMTVPTSKDKKTYTVNFKGLIAHLLDILFVDNAPRHYYATEMSAHIQKDVGLYR
ncbi:TPA: hypothetical protein ACMDRZ_001575 [Vibrio cholerae]|uniref:hypothetical protein n=1 Tax=Vibrio cholerae TaxID=666 RepID=UPI000F0B73BA|nr:hypothetical protein [Vibrio cholerae]EGQ9890278.1 hypothetical protein [Vibrio cholerae]EGR1464483.1 hypothetical protein [Vibrio cholerae]EHD2270228.1 hypothetical protein [Vibrio cholerae]EIJ2219537.1 hypothetical protein [Vibrio cholerae]EJL6588570.1 hypothetical protein [Vibrio cholerae]